MDPLTATAALGTLLVLLAIAWARRRMGRGRTEPEPEVHVASSLEEAVEVALEIGYAEYNSVDRNVWLNLELVKEPRPMLRVALIGDFLEEVKHTTFLVPQDVAQRGRVTAKSLADSIMARLGLNAAKLKQQPLKVPLAVALQQAITKRVAVRWGMLTIYAACGKDGKPMKWVVSHAHHYDAHNCAFRGEVLKESAILARQIQDKWPDLPLVARMSI